MPSPTRTATETASLPVTLSISAWKSPPPSDPLLATIRFEFVLVPAGERFELVRDGKVDILCDPSSVTLPRRDMVDFSLPTFLDGAKRRCTRTNRPVQRFEDLSGLADRRVGRHHHRTGAARFA